MSRKVSEVLRRRMVLWCHECYGFILRLERLTYIYIPYFKTLNCDEFVNNKTKEERRKDKMIPIPITNSE